MICPRCQKEIKDDSKFCVYCGNDFSAPAQPGDDMGATKVFAKVDAPAPQQPVTPEKTAAESTKNKKNKKKMIIAIVAIVLAVAVAGTSAFLLLSGKKSDSEEKKPETPAAAVSVDRVFKTQLNADYEKYGLCTNVETSTDVSMSTERYWTDRNGVVSAVIDDLDKDDVCELLTARIESGDDKRAIIFDLYECEDGKAVKADSVTVDYNGNDTGLEKTNAFLYEIDGVKNLCVESESKGILTDYDNPSYQVFDYNGKKFTEKLRIFRTYRGSDGNELTRTTPDKEDVIFRTAAGESPTGVYSSSQSPVSDAMEEFGFKPTSYKMISPNYPSYFDNASQKLFDIRNENISEMRNGVIELKNTVHDYTDVIKMVDYQPLQEDTQYDETSGETEKASAAPAQSASEKSRESYTVPEAPEADVDETVDYDEEEPDYDEGEDDEEDIIIEEETEFEEETETVEETAEDDNEIILPPDFIDEED